MGDPALELLLRHIDEYDDVQEKRTLHMDMALADLVNRGYIRGSCKANLRFARRIMKYRRALKRLLRRLDDRYLRREVTRELQFTLVILAAIADQCMAEVDDDDYDLRAELVEALRMFNARFEQCYMYKEDVKRLCIEHRLLPMLRGARNPAVILELLHR